MRPVVMPKAGGCVNKVNDAAGSSAVNVQHRCAWVRAFILSGVWLLLCDGLCAQKDGGDHAAVLRMQGLGAANEWDSLQWFADQLLDELPPAPSAIRYEAERHMAIAFSAKDDPVSALDHAQQAWLIADELNDTSRILGSLYQLTKLNVEGRHYEEADRFRRQHLALARIFGRDTKQLALAHNSVGSMHSRLENIDSAEFHYREGLRILGDSEPMVRQALLGNLASTLGAKGQHDEAARLFQQAFAELDSTELLNKAWTLRNLGQSLMSAARYDEALNTFEEGDSLNRMSGNTLDLAIDFAELRADALDSIGDVAGAYAMIKLARDLQDTLFERSMDEQLLELETKFGTRLKEEEIQRLDAQAREQDERLRLRNVQMYGSLVLALLALGGVLLVWRNLRQKRKHAVVLEGLNAELQDHQGRIEEINKLLQLKVLRAQINPHFIYNCLHAIGNLVRKGDTVGAAGYLDGFARLLRMVLDHSVKDRVPISQELDFLRQYLRLESLRFAEGLNYSVDADADLLEEDALVPSLLVQPFVENAIWHGLATKQGEKRLSVHFTERNGRIVCAVEDNGIGRTAAPKREHSDGSASMGLQLTTERLQLLTYGMQEAGRVTFTDMATRGVASGTRVEVVLG